MLDKQENRNELNKAIKRLFDGEDGKKVLGHLEEYVGYGYPSFVPGRDEKDAIFLDGQKALLAYIKNEIAKKLDETKPTEAKQ